MLRVLYKIDPKENFDFVSSYGQQLLQRFFASALCSNYYLKLLLSQDIENRRKRLFRIRHPLYGHFNASTKHVILPAGLKTFGSSAKQLSYKTHMKKVALLQES